MILSIAPRIVFLQNVLTNEQCSLITQSNVEFSKLGIVKEQQHIIDETYRSNYTYKDVDSKFTFLQEIAQDLLMSNSPNKNLNVIPESVQLQRYDIGQEYKPHLDFFNSTRNKVVAKDRVATVIFYLNDNFIGGETYFPRIDITVNPIKGAALIFYYNNNIEQLSMLTEHTGKPIINGTKFIATVWFDENE